MWQKIKAGIEAKLAAEESGVKKSLANWALGVAKDYAHRKANGQGIPIQLQVQHRVADTLVLSKVRHALGFDKIKITACGAAATPIEVLEFFLGLGIEINEVWGMSETTGASTTTLPGQYALGTVGKAVDGVELKLAADGELLVRGPVIMRGYRGQPEKTAETIDADGWLAHRRHREDRRRGLRDDRRPQEGTDHQRGRQEHVADQHRERDEGGHPADRSGGRDRRPAALQRRR